MDVVYNLDGLRIVDLTKTLDPKTETRRCHLYRFNTGGPIPDFHTIMDLTSHLGTHCECPYHHDDAWPSVAQLPLTTFFGRAIYVDIKDAKPNEHITAAMLDKWCAPKMKPGTIVIIDSPYKLPPFTEKTNGPEDKRLFVNGETAQWFKDHQAKCVGFGDGVGNMKLPPKSPMRLNMSRGEDSSGVLASWGEAASAFSLGCCWMRSSSSCSMERSWWITRRSCEARKLHANTQACR